MSTHASVSRVGVACAARWGDMFGQPAGEASARKCRLFAVACCHRIWPIMPANELVREWVGLAERLAEGECSELELRELDKIRRYSGGIPSLYLRAGRTHRTAAWYWAARAAYDALGDVYPPAPGSPADHFPPPPSLPDVPADCAEAAAHAAAAGTGEDFARLRDAAIGGQLGLFTDVFGDPGRPATLDPRWLTSTVVLMARGMYLERDFSAMPILADALQDAGCGDDDILGHCRGSSPHVLGCWVVDLVLGQD